MPTTLNIDEIIQRTQHLYFELNGKTTKDLQEQHANHAASLKNLKCTPKNEKLKSKLTATNFAIERILATRGTLP